MTAEEFEARVEKLIADARVTGMSDEAMIGVLHDAAEAPQEGFPDRQSPDGRQHRCWHGYREDQGLTDIVASKMGLDVTVFMANL